MRSAAQSWFYVLHKYMASRDLHVTPRSVPAQLRPAHDINLPLCFLGSSPIRCCACPSAHTVIISFVKTNFFVFFFTGKCSFLFGWEWPGEHGRGFVFQPRPAQSRAHFQATALNSLPPYPHHEMLLSLRLQTVNFWPWNWPHYLISEAGSAERRD